MTKLRTSQLLKNIKNKVTNRDYKLIINIIDELSSTESELLQCRKELRLTSQNLVEIEQNLRITSRKLNDSEENCHFTEQKLNRAENEVIRLNDLLRESRNNVHIADDGHDPDSKVVFPANEDIWLPLSETIKKETESDDDTVIGDSTGAVDTDSDLTEFDERCNDSTEHMDTIIETSRNEFVGKDEFGDGDFTTYEEAVDCSGDHGAEGSADKKTLTVAHNKTLEHTDTPDHYLRYKVCKCEKCGRTFSSLNTLQKHFQVHLNDKSFVCPIDKCDRSYATKKQLKCHLPYHDLDISKCESSVSKFGTKSDLSNSDNTDDISSVTICNIDRDFVSKFGDNSKLAYIKSVTVNLCGRINSTDECLKMDSMRMKDSSSVIISECSNVKSESANVPASTITSSKIPSTKSTLICIDCCRVFKSRKPYEKHVAVHKLDLNLSYCETCGKVCANKANLRTHMKKVHGTKKSIHKCDSCGRMYKFEYMLRRHSKTCGHSKNVTENDGKVTNSNECDGENVDVQRTNSNECTGSNKIETNKIDPEFDTESDKMLSGDTDDNKKQTTENKPHKVRTRNTPSCTECGKICRSNSDLIKHMGSHNKPKIERSAICEECGKVFGSAAKQRRHMACHVTELPYACSYCARRFARKEGCVQHERTHTGSRPFNCRWCLKTFTYASTRQSHEQTHKTSRPFKCDHCEWSFVTKKSLVRHSTVHTNTRLYTCRKAACEKAFNSAPGRNSHEKTHTGERRFCCEVCGQKFRHKHHLNTHSLLHTGLKPHVCSICSERRFCYEVCGQKLRHKHHLNTHSLLRHKHHLNTHSLLHTRLKPHVSTICGERRFCCEVCGQKFRHKHHLNTHSLLHTGLKPHVCAICSASFTYLTSLHKHTKQKHNATMSTTINFVPKQGSKGLEKVKNLIINPTMPENNRSTPVTPLHADPENKRLFNASDFNNSSINQTLPQVSSIKLTTHRNNVVLDNADISVANRQNYPNIADNHILNNFAQQLTTQQSSSLCKSLTNYNENVLLPQIIPQLIPLNFALSTSNVASNQPSVIFVPNSSLCSRTLPNIQPSNGDITDIVSGHSTLSGTSSFDNLYQL